MSSFKKQAIKLKESLKSKGSEIPLVSVQESLAHSYGFNNRHIALDKEEEFNELLTQIKHKITLKESKLVEPIVSKNTVIDFVNSLIFCGFVNNAQEIHIIPSKVGVNYSLLLDGNFVKLKTQSLKSNAAVCARIKVMANMEIEEEIVSQYGEILITKDYGPLVEGKSDSSLNLAVAVYTSPNEVGERIILRIEKSGSPEYQRIQRSVTFWDRSKDFTREERQRALQKESNENIQEFKVQVNDEIFEETDQDLAAIRSMQEELDKDMEKLVGKNKPPSLLDVSDANKLAQKDIEEYSSKRIQEVTDKHKKKKLK